MTVKRISQPTVTIVVIRTRIRVTEYRVLCLCINFPVFRAISLIGDMLEIIFNKVFEVINGSINNLLYFANNNLMDDLVKIKKLKGKQNKKKWTKNIDVSGLLQNIEDQHNQEIRAQYQQPLIVEDTTQKQREELHPERFKNRPRSTPKPKYDNSYKRDNLLQDGNEDIWNQPIEAPKKRPKLTVPAVVKPSSGHSYNPRPEDIDDLIDEVIDYEGKKKPLKEKKIKKVRDIKIVPRSRNKKVRQEYLAAQERRKERLRKNQLNSVKSLHKQIDEKNKQIYHKITDKQARRQKLQKEAEIGKVREGPKLGKKRYQYKQYIPNESQIGKRISKVGLNDELMRDRFDSVFRRGVFEPRQVKAHRNRRKNIKVSEKFREE